MSDFSEEGKQYLIEYIDDCSKDKLERFIEEGQGEKSDEKEVPRKRSYEIKKLAKSHLLTTGYDFEGYRITSYNGIVTGSVVLGTGMFSEFEADVSDIFGMNSNSFALKLESAKDDALEILKEQSVEKGDNAAIGVAFNYISLKSNMIGVIASGTSVCIEHIEDSCGDDTE